MLRGTNALHQLGPFLDTPHLEALVAAEEVTHAIFGHAGVHTEPVVSSEENACIETKGMVRSSLTDRAQPLYA